MQSVPRYPVKLINFIFQVQFIDTKAAVSVRGLRVRSVEGVSHRSYENGALTETLPSDNLRKLNVEIGLHAFSTFTALCPVAFSVPIVLQHAQ